MLYSKVSRESIQIKNYRKNKTFGAHIWCVQKAIAIYSSKSVPFMLRECKIKCVVGGERMRNIWYNNHK